MDLLGLGRVQVVLLGGVGGEVEQFPGFGVRCVPAIPSEPGGFASLGVVVAGRGQDEHPVALADGELALSAVMDRRLAEWGSPLLTDLVFSLRGRMRVGSVA
jgi:hypothetical protein